MSDVSIIVPVLDEAAAIAQALAPLQAARARGAEVVVVDGGSRDGTPTLARPWADQVIVAARGRALQMNAGAHASRCRHLVFLHADTVLPANGVEAVEAALRDAPWGRFDVAIAGEDPLLAIVASCMNLRSRLSGIATGDQALFVRREAFEAVGGFPAIPLMEDIAFSRTMLGIARPACLRERVLTYGRRWEQHGVLRTIALMWRLRLEYALGADPHRLARRYGVERTSS
jgi:rSAM/selenodomain-associated transferase 2